ncbi:MAG: U32 family peptidase C-terminal domain-containing protein, partial [Eubacteriales bacterium]|nr:U32 family peptidase C-terminal domain-containing protein [Eubacteriales bacterium]
DCLFVAVVKDVAAGMALLQQRNRFAKGDVLEVVSPAAMGRRIVVEDLWDLQGRPLDDARHPAQLVRLRTDVPLLPYDMLRRRLR